MRCLNCGAEIIKDQSFCTSCGSKITKENLYDVKIPYSTKNMKAITIAARIIGKSKVKTAARLAKPNALIASGISLSEAAKIKSLFKKISMTVKIDSKIMYNFQKRTSVNKMKIIDNDQKSELNEPQEQVMTENDTVIANRKNIGSNNEKKIKKRQIKNKDSKKKFLNFSPVVMQNIFLIFTVMILLTFIVFVLMKLNNGSVLKSGNLTTDSLKNPIEKHSVSQEIARKKLSNLFKNNFSKEKNRKDGEKSKLQEKNPLSKRVQKKGKRVKAVSNDDIEKTINKLEQIDVSQKEKVINELKDMLRSVSSPNLQQKMKEKAVKKIQASKDTDRIPAGNYQTGEVALQGLKFVGNTNLPDKTQLFVKIKEPAGKIKVKSCTVKRGRFSVEPFDKLAKGDYEINVEIKSLPKQLAVLRDRLSELIKEFKISPKSNVFLFHKTISLSLPKDLKVLYSKAEAREFIEKLLRSAFAATTVEYENLLQQFVDDILIQGTADSEKEFILKSCAGVGFTAINSIEENNDLIIIVNNNKYQIPVRVCAKAMKLVNNNFTDPKFEEYILKYL